MLLIKLFTINYQFEIFLGSKESKSTLLLTIA